MVKFRILIIVVEIVVSIKIFWNSWNIPNNFFDLFFRLDLRNNDIGLGGLMALSLAARENKSLTRLDLDKPPRDSTLPPELIVSQKSEWSLES